MAKKTADVWMPMYWGDYLKDTRGLTLIEHGAYLMLIAEYWNKGCLKHCLEHCSRIACAFTEDERAAVASVLDQFFDVDESGQYYAHSRIDSELEKANKNKDKAKERAEKAAAARWGKNTSSNATSNATSIPQAMPEDMLEECPSPSPSPINNKTYMSEPEGSNAAKPKIPDCPHQEIIGLYHETLPVCARVAKWTDKRRSHLQARWREDPERQCLDWWKRLFGYIAQSDFLCGRTPPSPGRKTFTADLEWIINASNFVKIIEGKYHA